MLITFSIVWFFTSLSYIAHTIYSICLFTCIHNVNSLLMVLYNYLHVYKNGYIFIHLYYYVVKDGACMGYDM